MGAEPPERSCPAPPPAAPPEGRRAAVLGSPVAHSLSPAMHRAAHAAFGLRGWRYDAVDVDEAALPDVLAGLGPQWAGLSLTMPLKRAVVPLLDELDPVAAATGVVNTVTWTTGERRAVGANTDVEGVVAALTPHLRRAADGPGGPVPGDLVPAGPAPAGPVPGRRGAVLGGGATAVSAVLALGRLGCRHVDAHVREPRRATALLAVAERCGVEVALRPWAGAARALDAADVVVSTAPRGAADEVAAALGTAGAPGDRAPVLLDVVYDPWPTALARAWAVRGPVVDGSEMLVHQAVAQVRLMTGRSPAASVLRAAVVAERARRAARGG